MIKKLIQRSLLTVLIAAVLCGFAWAVESKESDITMVVGSSCYVYKTQTATAAYRADYLTFGQEVYVLELGSKWATIQYNGSTLYIQSKNLKYITDTVIKNRVMVSPGAYAVSASKSLGYVFYGSDVYVLGTSTNKQGITYVHCFVNAVYTEDGKTVKAEQVEGYINQAYLRNKATPMIVNGGTNLYAAAYGASSSSAVKNPVGTITTGEQVSVLMSNSTWSKVSYQGKEYYMSTGKLDPYELQVMVNRVIQTYDAKPGSGFQHYLYWNSKITVLGTYESDTYGTYYYCKVGGDYGFIREYSSTGLQYVGSNTTMQTVASTSLYDSASNSANKITTLPANTSVTVEYVSDAWAKVLYQGKVGYMLTEKLEYPQYSANGSVYSTAYQLYKKVRSGSIKDTVQLVAKNDKYGYAYVLTKDGEYLWMRTSSLEAQSELEAVTMYTAVPIVTLYKQASSAYPSMEIPYMTELIYKGTVSSSTAGSWLWVVYQGTEYYIWAEQGETVLTETKSSGIYVGTTEIQQEVLDTAMDICNNWATKYEHNQSNGVADSDGYYGFDCSGFVSYVLNSVMQKQVPLYILPKRIEALYNTVDIYNKGYMGAFGSTVVCSGSLDEKALQPGDVLFFNLQEEYSEQIQGLDYNHCGIYLGNGEFVHCTHSWGGGVRVMPLKGIYQSGFVAAKRYLPERVTRAEKTMYTWGSVTNVYGTNDSDTNPIAVLKAETAVTLYFTDNGNWAYVEYEPGRFGFILVQYLSESLEEVSEIRYVSSTSLKLYTADSTDSSFVEVAIATPLKYKGHYGTGSYYKVEYQENNYFVYAPNGIDTRLTTDVDALLAGNGTKTVIANTKLRSSMDSKTDNNVLKMVYQGAVVTWIATSDSGTWSYVKTEDGTYGYLLANKLN